MRIVTRFLLSKFGGGVVKREEVKTACKKFRANYTSTINFMISYGYFIRILRGLYYVKTIEEFKLKKSVDPYKIISLGLNRLGLNWYFGLYTALRLNGLTHEFFRTIFVVNDEIYRPKEIEIAGEKVKFLKLKSKLLSLGVVDRNGIRFSDTEKTLLDFTYVFRYRGLPEEKIISAICEYRRNLDRKKLKAYLRLYPKSVEKIIKNAGLI
jgi:predicted transcriptional regulator of viral defense system